MLTIIQEPNQLLHKRCEPVSDFNQAEQIVEELLAVIKSKAKFWNRRLGFAANQIGYTKRILVIRKGKNYTVMINPIILEKKIPFPYLENCYSLKQKSLYLVKRYLYAKVSYQDPKGEWHETALKGPSAIYQEMDHINGIMVSEVGWRIL